MADDQDSVSPPSPVDDVNASSVVDFCVARDSVAAAVVTPDSVVAEGGNRNNIALDSNNNNNGNINGTRLATTRPLILITGSPSSSLSRYPLVGNVGNSCSEQQQHQAQNQHQHHLTNSSSNVHQAREVRHSSNTDDIQQQQQQDSSELQSSTTTNDKQQQHRRRTSCVEEEQVEEVDGISYRIVAAVTKPLAKQRGTSISANSSLRRPRSSTTDTKIAANSTSLLPMMVDKGGNGNAATGGNSGNGPVQRRINSVRRKSSAFVSNLLNSSFLGPQSASSHDLNSADSGGARQRRLSIYEMTKSPPPETSLEMYLSERRRSSTVSARQVQQTLEQQSTFETNYCQRQQYFKDLNQKLINQDKKLLNVVANRGQIHRHSVDIAQLPLHSAQAQAKASRNLAAKAASNKLQLHNYRQQQQQLSATTNDDDQDKSNAQPPPPPPPTTTTTTINQWLASQTDARNQSANNNNNNNRTLMEPEESPLPRRSSSSHRRLSTARRSLFDQRGSVSSRSYKKSRLIIRKFQKLDQTELSSTPAPDVKIGQRVAYKEYYGNEFGTIRWIGRVPQICPDWTVGVEFDNAIGEGDGSLNGRRYFIAKDCFAKFLPLSDVALVDQHIGRPEPGTMISVMSAAVRPGQMISIQRVSTVHVQHCFMNAPHRMLGADILAVNTRLHCQCPNCGPCAHVIKPPRTQRLARGTKNATHMCQFSTYTCCGMESQEETMCAYTGNKVVSSITGLPPVGNSWIEGAGYLSNLQAQQSKAMPEEYKLGAAPEDVQINPDILLRRQSRSLSRRGSGKRHHKREKRPTENVVDTTALNLASNPNPSTQIISQLPLVDPLLAKNAEQWSPPCPLTPEPYQYALACPDKVAPEDRIWKESSSKNSLKSPKVVYRDSIENRYLFPTDDLIDSTLEADLENLSQARYGHHNSRHQGSRRLLKSLRSLVSCLSAQSNHSDLGRHSENTVEFLDYGVKGQGNKSVPERLTSRSEQDSNQFNLDYQKENDNCTGNSNQTKLAKQPPNLLDNAAKRHISSSTDCGFSSASQNSINYQSFPTCSPILSADDERRTKQIYQRIVARLLASTSVTSEELLRLKKVLFEPHYDSCCLHNSLNKACTNTFNSTESDQIIADILRKSILYKDRSHEHSQIAPCCQQQATNYCLSGSNLGIEEREEQHYAISERYLKMVGTGKNVAHSTTQHQAEFSHLTSNHAPRSLVDSCSTHGSVTLSSCDSFSANAGASDGQQSNISLKDRKKKEKTKAEEKSVENSNLPQAFELKLTLSINSDKKSPSSGVESYEVTDCSAVEVGSDEIGARPSLNINITSTGKKDPSENLMKSVPNHKSEKAETNQSGPINQEQVDHESIETKVCEGSGVNS